MFNVLKIQNALKNASDEQLAQEMRMPSGLAPQYLVMTEMQRRQKMRSEFSGQEPPKTTMADEMSGAAPEMPQMAPPQGGPQEQPQGGVQEQMPPTAMMAAGGAVGAPQFNSVFAGSGPATGVSSPQFGNLFGAPAGNATTSAYAPIVEAPYVAPPETANSNPYQSWLDSMRSRKGTPNPRVNRPANEKYGIPAGMALPTYGTPGLIVKYNKNDRPSYSWRSDADRDAYIRYMTPPEKKADGGPIRMGGGMEVDAPYAPPPLRPYVDPYKYMGMSDDELQRAASSSDPTERENAAFYLKNRNSQSRIGRAADTAIRGIASAGSAVGSAIKEYGPYMIPGAAPTVAAYRYGPQVYDYLTSPGKPLVPGYESERGHGRDVGLTPVDTGLGPSPENPAIGATAPKKKSAGSAGVSGPPPADQGGLAALRAQQTQPTVQSRAGGGSEYERQANALLDQLRGDKEADKNRDLNNALIHFGLGMAGSKNPNLLGAVSEGGLPAIQKYGETRESRRKEERGLTADQLAILAKKTDIDTAQSKADQDAEQARWEREEKFPEEQRLREAQIKASLASAARNTDIETLNWLTQPGNEKALELWKDKNSNMYGTDSRVISAAMKEQQRIYGDFKNPIAMRQAAEKEYARLAALLPAMGTNGGMTGASAAPDPRDSGLVPVN